MNSNNNPWQSYRKITTQTASPSHLVLMLYDGAIRFLEKGLLGFEFTDPVEFNQTISNNLLRAQAIIHEMNARLDMTNGGEVAQTLRRLYTYFYRRLQEANAKKKKPPIEEVARHLRILRDSWAQMVNQGLALPKDEEAATASQSGGLQFA
jgi:flagellar protein FliS